MEIYEMGYLVFGFIAGMAWGCVMISVIYFYYGRRKKEKTEALKVEDRLSKIEERLGL
jgi:hypothetical protein